MKIFKFYIDETNFHFVSGEDHQAALTAAVEAELYGIERHEDIVNVEEVPEEEWDSIVVSLENENGELEQFTLRESLEDTAEYIASNFEW